MKIFISVIYHIDIGIFLGMFLYFYMTDWKKPAVFPTWLLKILGMITLAAFIMSWFVPRNAHAESLCMKLNNPMCVTGSKANPWEGQIKLVSGGLVHFKSMEHGLRAGAITLLAYKRKHKIDTLTALLRRYCTGNREKYEKHLKTALRVRDGQKIDIEAKLPELMAGIIQFENGYSKWTVQDLKAMFKTKIAFLNIQKRNSK